jgi:release factor glutamine methyltransferase
VRDWEPRIALGTEDDALHFYRRLAREAPPLLAPGGALVVEVGQGQADPVAKLWQGAGLQDVAVLADYAGTGRVVTGNRR